MKNAGPLVKTVADATLSCPLDAVTFVPAIADTKSAMDSFLLPLSSASMIAMLSLATATVAADRSFNTSVVALPEEVTFPVRLAFVVTVAALPDVFWLPELFTPGRSMLPVPSNDTPPISRAVANAVAVAAKPDVA